MTRLPRRARIRTDLLPEGTTIETEPRSPRAWLRSARVAALVVAAVLVVVGAAVALVPFHGSATASGRTVAASCGSPLHERAASNPMSDFVRFLLSQAESKNATRSSAEHAAPAAPGRPAEPAGSRLERLARHYAACHDAAERRFTLGSWLAVAGLLGLAAVYVTSPVRREERRERRARLGYQPALDGLRALSIVVVMLFHAGLRSRFVGAGYLGVGSFFVLSGFLITTLVLDEHRRWRHVSFRHFYARRALRLLPLVAVLVAFASVLFVVLPHDNVARPNGSSILGTAFYFSNWVEYFNPHTQGVLGHTWSLAIEEQFYLVWPPVLVWLLVRGTRRSWIAVVTGALAVGSAVWRLVVWHQAETWRPAPGTGLATAASQTYHHLDQAWNRWYVSSFTRADALLVGCLAAVLMSTLFVTNVRGRRVLRVLAVAGVVAVCGVYWATGKPNLAFPSFLPEWGLFVFSVGVAVVIAWVVFEPASLFARALSLPPMTWIGKRSYGMYVIHWPVVELLNPHLHFGQWNVAITVGLSVILSAISFRFLESPMLRIKDRFSRTRDTDSSPHEPAPDVTPEVAVP